MSDFDRKRLGQIYEIGLVITFIGVFISSIIWALGHHDVSYMISAIAIVTMIVSAFVWALEQSLSMYKPVEDADQETEN